MLSPKTPPSSATAAAVTAVRLRRAQRRARRETGSRQAETDSSAANLSRSSARARGAVYRSTGASAIAFRQIASRAGSMLGSICRGGRTSPRCTARITSRASPPNGGLPVRRQYSVAPKLYTSLCGPPDRGRPRPARDSCMPGFPARCPVAFPSCRWPKTAAAFARRQTGRICRSPLQAPSQRPASRHTGRRQCSPA